MPALPLQASSRLQSLPKVLCCLPRYGRQTAPLLAAPNPECSLGLLGLSEVQSIFVTDSQTLPLAGLATDLLADGTVGNETFELKTVPGVPP